MKKLELITFPKSENVGFKFAGLEIEVKPYINMKDESVMIATYLDIYFNSEGKDMFKGMDTNFWGAEIAFDISILDMMTSIDSLSDEIDMDDVYSSGLMDKVREKITNLHQVRRRLERVIADTRQEKFSVMGLMKELASLLEGFDFSKIQDAAKQIKKLESDIADSPISTLMDEGRK